MSSEEGWNNLIEYVLNTAHDRPGLLNYRPRTATAASVVKEDALIVGGLPQARLSVLLAEALVAMSQDVHAEGDRATLDSEPLTPAKAVVLVKEYGGFRPAAKATGVNYQKLWRAVKDAEKEGVGIGE